MAAEIIDGLVKTLSKTTKEIGKATKELGARAEQGIEALRPYSSADIFILFASRE